MDFKLTGHKHRKGGRPGRSGVEEGGGVGGGGGRAAGGGGRGGGSGGWGVVLRGVLVRRTGSIGIH